MAISLEPATVFSRVNACSPPGKVFGSEWVHAAMLGGVQLRDCARVCGGYC